MPQTYLVNVVPIARGLSRDSLSYFSGVKPEVGTIVSVPLRTRSVPAIVISTANAAAAKSSIKSSAYAVRKVRDPKGVALFLPEFVAATKTIAEYTAGHASETFYALTPSAIIEAPKTLAPARAALAAPEGEETTIEKLVFQAGRAERAERYRSLVREEFARKASVFILVPTIADAEYLEEALAKGVARYVTVLHATLPKKELRARWSAALASDHPVCIIGTTTFLSLPRGDIGTIIVEREGASGYKSQRRPYLDGRFAAEKLAEELRARFILAGLPLRVDTMHRFEKHELDDLDRMKTRLPHRVTAEIVDMRVDRDAGGSFKVLGDAVVGALSEAHQRGHRSFVFAARRGLAPNTVCGDCGETVLCSACKAAVVLHKSASGNVYLCHACGAMRAADTRCAHCDSWKLVPLGIGIERVEEVVRELLPEAPVIRFDRDHIKSHAGGRDAAIAFYQKPGSILVGTEMALPYIAAPVSTVAVASADSLLSLPEWRTHERVFSLLIALCERAEQAFFIQTRQPDEPLFKEAADGHIAGFYRDELRERKQFNYPPFSVLIKLSASGTRAKVEEEVAALAETFKADGFLSYAPSLHVAKGRYVMHGLIKKPADAWPDRDLVERLRALPPHISVDVEPDRLM